VTERQTEALEKLNQGIQESRREVQQRTMNLAKDYFGGSAEALKQQINESRSTLEGLPDQIPGGREEAFQALFQELMDNYSHMEECIDEARQNVVNLDTDQIRRQGEVEATDAARREARERGVDLTQVEGTGSDGRIIVSDVVEAAEAMEEEGGPASQAAQQAQDAAGQAAQQAQDTAGQVTDQAGQAVQGVQDTVGGLTGGQQGGPLGGVTDQVGQVAQGVQDTAGQATEQVSRRLARQQIRPVSWRDRRKTPLDKPPSKPRTRQGRPQGRPSRPPGETGLRSPEPRTPPGAGLSSWASTSPRSRVLAPGGS
jgi:hypothetical protein